MYSNNQATTDNTQGGFNFGGRGRGCGNGKHWGHKFGGQAPWMKHFAGAFGNRIPVNIEETDEAFYLYLYAAGLNKEAIQLSVKNEVLSIAYKAAEQEETKESFSHREHSVTSFERLFQLNEKVLTEQISAAYADGVLKVTLPKDPDNNKPAQHVTVR